MITQHSLCDLCQKPTFSERAETSLFSCSLCFQLVKVAGSIMVTDSKTSEKILLSQTEISNIDSLEGIQVINQDLSSEIENYIKNIRKLNMRKQKSGNQITEFVDDQYLKQLQNVVNLWKKSKVQIKQIIKQISLNPLENMSKNQIPMINLQSLQGDKSKQKSKQSNQSLNTKLLQSIKNIYKNSSNKLFTKTFSVKQEFQAYCIKEFQIKTGQKQNQNKQSITSRNHFSHNVSLENSIVKLIPKIQETKKKSHKNITSVVSSGISPEYKLKTESSSTKNQIEWLLTNLQHNPQGFKDTTSDFNPSRKVSIQPMNQCISKALKATTVSSNNLSLSGFDVSKLAFDCYLDMTQITKSIHSIKLVKVGMTDNQFNLLLCFTARHENIKNLVVTNNQLTDESLQMLLNFVKKIKQLEKVYMGNNPIKALSGKQLVKKIKENGIESIYI